LLLSSPFLLFLPPILSHYFIRHSLYFFFVHSYSIYGFILLEQKMSETTGISLIYSNVQSCLFT
jgi:hypothetical protein